MDDQASLSIGALALDPNNPDRLYVATGEGNAAGEALPGVGLFIWNATLRTWQLLGNAQLNGTRVRRMIIDARPPAPNRILLATNLGVMESPDDGVSWAVMATALPVPADVTDIALDPGASAATAILYVAVLGKGVYSRTGAGTANFNQLPSGQSGLGNFATTGRIAIALCPAHPANIYAVYAATDGTILGIYYSESNGAAWKDPLPLPAKDLRQGFYNLVLTVHPTDPQTVFFGEANLWRSSNGGNNWTNVSNSHGASPGIHPDQHALVFSPADATNVWAGNDGGVWLSIDSGQTFYHRNRGLQTFQYYSLAQHPDDDSIMLGGAQDNGSHRFEGHPAWDLTTYGDGFYCAIDQTEPFRWYASYVYVDGDKKIRAIQRSESSGKPGSWSYIVDGIQDTFPDPKNRPFYNPFVTDPTNQAVLYLGTNQLYRTDNHGDGWSAVVDQSTSQPWTTGATQSASITAIAVNPYDATSVYVGTFDGRVFLLQRQAGGTYIVNDLAGTPATADRKLPNDIYISDIAIPPALAGGQPDRAYVAFGSPQLSGVPIPNIVEGRIFLTHVVAGTRQWQPLKTAALDLTVSGIAIPHTSNPVNAIAVDPTNPAVVYIGCNLGIFSSTDSGTTWTPYTDNLPNVAISDLQLHAKKRLLRAATMGRGVWERSVDPPVPAPPATGVTLYIRDNIVDEARIATPATAPDPLSQGDTVTPLSGADIKIDTPFIAIGSFQTPASTETYLTGAPADYLAFPQFTSDNLRRGSTSRLYAEVMNRGPVDATNVKIRAFYASKTGTTYPDLPANFWTSFPDSDPDVTVWKSFGDMKTLGTVRPGQPKVATWEYNLPSSDAGPIGVLLVTTCTEDPLVVAPADPNVKDAAAIAAAQRHIALREVSTNLPAGAIVAIVFLALGVVALGGLATAAGLKKL
jgi:hypothetical protein